MYASKRIAALVQQDPRMRAVPPAVIEDVLRIGFNHLVSVVPAKTLAEDLNAVDFAACEACGHLIDSDEPEGATADVEGVWLCSSCGDTEPAPSGPAPTPGGES